MYYLGNPSPMDYSELACAYESIGSTAKRLEMAALLEALFRKATPDEARMITYLTQGSVAPDFKGLEFGVAEKMALRAIGEATRLPEDGLLEDYKRNGDLGVVASEAMSRKRQTSLYATPLTLARVFESLQRLASAGGGGSQDLRTKLIAELLHDSSPVEAKYIVRTLVGKLRLGVAAMSIIDALAQAYVTKEQRDEVEAAYNVCSDLGLVAFTLAKDGISGLASIRVSPGTPIRVMLCERLPGIPDILKKLGKCALEYKYDGLRIQAHSSGGKLALYTRQMEEVSAQFPDVVGSLSIALKGHDAIVEGECVPVDQDTGDLLPFQTVSHRRGRKYGLDAAVKDFPVHVFLFDCLYLDGKDFTSVPFPERRKALMSTVRGGDGVAFAQSIVTDDEAEAERFFDQSISSGGEGIVAKSIAPESVYRAGARGWLWIKYKRDYRSEMIDTVDLVVVGAFAGRGRRAGSYGALLMAVRNPSTGRYETVTKLGSGFDDANLAELPKLLDGHKLKSRDKSVDSQMKADAWFEPAVVMEVVGAELTLSPVHTCARDRLRKGSGLAVRFPRFAGNVRSDKKAEDATTTDEMVEMYRAQLKKIE